MYGEKGNALSVQIEEGNSFWFEHRNNVIYQVTKNYPFAGDFSDIGGGNGYQLAALKKKYTDRKFYLIEPGYAGCQTAKRRGIDEVYNCTFEEFDFTKTQIDGVGLFDVLEHIPDDLKFLRELHDRIRPGTRVYITVPAYQLLWNDVDDYGKHQRRYNKKSMLSLIRNTSFKPEYFTYFFSYLVAPTFLLRTVPYKISGGRTEEQILASEFAQHKPSKLQDTVFGMFNSYELNTIGKNKSLWYGASCFIVLKK